MAGSSVLLETRALTKEFRGLQAVGGVDLAVRQGEIHALIGPNGAGKTTVFNLISKFLAPTSGTIRFGGEDITAEPPARVARRGIVRSFQISAVFPHLTVLENLRLVLQREKVSAYRFWEVVSKRWRLDERAMAILEDVGLGDIAHIRAGQLPYGHKRALELATTFAADPVIMLLDEPTQGLGHEDVARIAVLIRRMAADRTVLMVEHNMGVVAEIAGRISVLQHGRIIAEGTYDEVAGDPQVIEAYLGSGARGSGGGDGRH